ncbi:MAG: hypothetical protein QOD72_900, partial [Acidimicrobiaceae bacterium]|nr:hypothetical protein [Acidimicrobiaceae bacterium]
RVDDDRLGAYDGIADDLYRFNFRPSVERPRAWLASRCRGEWILWLDGDEVLSPAFVATLPTLILDDQLAQYWFTRRWLFPDTGHWIDENPWWPDLQVRLIRNKAFTMWFGRMHEPFGSSLPARHLDLPIYHLACVIASVSERLTKAKGYDDVAPGRVSPGGGPFNQVLYVPERYATLRPQPVPADDRAAIDHVLAAPRLAGASKLSIHFATDDEVDAVSPDRDLADDDYRARITVLERDTRFAPGCPRSLLVRVHNDSQTTWPYGSHSWPQLRLGTHWHRADGELILWDGDRTPLPNPLRPGHDLLAALTVKPPSAPGLYRLTIDMVDEGRRWFDCGTTFTVIVADRWRRFDAEFNPASCDRTECTAT